MGLRGGCVDQMQTVLGFRLFQAVEGRTSRKLVAKHLATKDRPAGMAHVAPYVVIVAR